MAIEREIPRDISRYKTKLIGTFTTRNVVCGIPGLILGIGTYFLVRPYASQDAAIIAAIIIASPILLCGWAEPYGIPFEKFISIVFVSQVLAPKHIKYVTENTYKEFGQSEEASKSMQGKKNAKKKHNKVFVSEYQQYM